MRSGHWSLILEFVFVGAQLISMCVLFVDCVWRWGPCIQDTCNPCICRPHIIMSQCQKVGCPPTPAVYLLLSVGSALPTVWMKCLSLQEPSHFLRQPQPSESRNHRHKSLHLARRKHVGHWRNVSFECHWYKYSQYQSHSLIFLLYQMCHSGHYIFESTKTCELNLVA